MSTSCEGNANVKLEYDCGSGIEMQNYHASVNLSSTPTLRVMEGNIGLVANLSRH